MSNIIPINTIPNQIFTIQLDNNLYGFALKSANGFMYFDLIRNNVPIILGGKLISYAFLIPYRYLENGNFVLLTANEEYPDYTQFGITQLLIYLPQAELGTYREQN